MNQTRPTCSVAYPPHLVTCSDLLTYLPADLEVVELQWAQLMVRSASVRSVISLMSSCSVGLGGSGLRREQARHRHVVACVQQDGRVAASDGAEQCQVIGPKPRAQGAQRRPRRAQTDTQQATYSGRPRRGGSREVTRSARGAYSLHSGGCGQVGRIEGAVRVWCEGGVDEGVPVRPVEGVDHLELLGGHLYAYIVRRERIGKR